MRYLALCFLMVGCGTSTTADDEGGSPDATTNDSPSGSDSGKDGSVADTGADSASDSGMEMDSGGMDAAPDSPMGMGCKSPADCKLFSSYCSTDPCKCIPLEKQQPNPACMGMKVTCLIDPCLNKTATCTNGMCGVQ